MANEFGLGRTYDALTGADLDEEDTLGIWDGSAARFKLLPADVLNAVSITTHGTTVEAALQAIDEASTAGRFLYVPDALTYSGDLPGIHDVQLKGPGSIKIGTGRPWWAEPSERNTTFSAPMTLYVDPAGDDDNSGLSPAFPLATLQKAADILDLYKAPLLGFWRIILAAGDYNLAAAKADFVGMQNTFENPLYISGPEPASAWDNTDPPSDINDTGGSIPTAIFTGTGVDSDGYAISAASQSHIVVEHIKFVSWGSSSGANTGAGQAKDWSSIRMANCHVWNGAEGACGRENSDIVIEAGYYKNLRKFLFVIGSRFQTSRGATEAGDNYAELVEECDWGCDLWEGANGHCDYTHFLNTNFASIYLRRLSHCAMAGPTFEKSTSGDTIAVHLQHSGQYVLEEDAAVYTTSNGGTITRTFHESGTLNAHEPALNWRTVAYDAADQTTSGTDPLDFLTYDVEAYTFVKEGQALRVKIYFTQSLANADANFAVRLEGAAVTVTAPSQMTAGLFGWCEIEIFAKGAASQFYHAHVYAANPNSASVFVQDVAAGDLTEDMTADRTLTVRATCADGSDSVTIKAVTVERMG